MFVTFYGSYKSLGSSKFASDFLLTIIEEPDVRKIAILSMEVSSDFGYFLGIYLVNLKVGRLPNIVGAPTHVLI